MDNTKYDAVFQGGGVKGIAFAGALKRFEEEGVGFRRYAGTSAGAITAGLCSAGYDAEELKDILWSTDFTEFADPKKIFKGNFFTILWRFVGLFWSKLGYGLFSTDPFYKWFNNLLEKKSVSSFESVPFYLRVFASDVAQRKLMQFDKDNAANMEIAEAVRMSMSFPFFFRATTDNINNSLAVDGGLLADFPIATFDDVGGCKSTIGFRLVSDKQLKAHKIPKNIGAFILSIIETMQAQIERSYIDEAYWARTIPIPTGNIETLNFNLTEEEKSFLYKSGYDAVDKAIKKGLLKE